jgi:hypothetical protein
MTKNSEERLLRCKAHVDDEGRLSMTYRWSHLDVDGHDSHDEDVSDWSDRDIRDLVASLIGIENEGDIEKIEVVR